MSIRYFKHWPTAKPVEPCDEPSHWKVGYRWAWHRQPCWKCKLPRYFYPVIRRSAMRRYDCDRLEVVVSSVAKPYKPELLLKAGRQPTREPKRECMCPRKVNDRFGP
jgi:hypothetical protein